MVSEMPKFPWDMPRSDRLLYETIARMAPEDRTPVEASVKRYIDMLLAAIEGLDASRERAQTAEAEVCTKHQRVQELEKALRIARGRMAHRFNCVKVTPTETWHVNGSVTVGACICEIATVEAALAGAQKEAAK
jgi:hypothetical protein